MPEAWFSSDTHFYHEAVMNFCPESRGRFACSAEMDNFIIEEHNKRVRPKDDYYHLGDFAFCGFEEACDLLGRMNGKKHLIVGNHDRKLIKKGNPGFATIQEYLFTKYYGEPLALFHFPIWEWEQIHRGAIHLHGHVHGKKTGIPGKAIDVGVDTNDLLPYNLDSIRSIALNLETRTHSEN